MKNLLFILTVATMLLGATNSTASPPLSRFDLQQGERIKLFSNEEFFSKADYIIEVRFTGIYPTFYDVGGNYNPDEFYTSRFMIVTYVYKNSETMSISPGDTLTHFAAPPSKNHKK